MCVHEGRVVLVGDGGGGVGGAVVPVDGALARGGHDDGGGERQPHRAQAEQEGQRLGTIWLAVGRHHMAAAAVGGDRYHMAVGRDHDDPGATARTLS